MSLYLSFLMWAFYSCYRNIHLSVVFLMPFSAMILTATLSFYPNAGFVWNSWTAAHSSQSITPLLLWSKEKAAWLRVLLHRTSKRNLAFIQNQFIVVLPNQKKLKNLTNKASPKPWWLIYFDASFSNFKIGKICWNSSRIWTQIPHKWYWNHPLPAFREVLLISFYGLRVEWEMSARSESAGEARPLLPFICVHQFRPHWALTLAPHCSIGGSQSRHHIYTPSAAALSQEPPQEHQTQN